MTRANEPIENLKKISSPFEYRGYSFPEYEGIKKHSEYVEMSDGVKLAVDIYRPTSGPDQESFPVVMEYTPYSRAFVDPKNSLIRRIFRKFALKSNDPVIDLLDGLGLVKPLKQLISHGYVFVRADIRGSGASYGQRADFLPKLGEDGVELVDWIGTQPWCDGNVGMLGGSYMGISQIVTAGHMPDALKCIVPMIVPFDGYCEVAYPGGVYLHGFMMAYSKILFERNLNYHHFNILKILLGERNISLPAAPVVDEDGDGWLFDEIPLDLNKNGYFLDDYVYPANPSDEPQYKDGEKREHIYYLANIDHKQNPDCHKRAKSMLFLDSSPIHPLENELIYDFNPSSYVPEIMESGIAVYNIGCWFGPYVRGTTEYYCTMKNTNPSKMTIVPGYHRMDGPFWKYLGEDPKSLQKKGGLEIIRFFDHYLKDIDNGIEKESPIYIYVMNDGFRFENEWPLARQVVTDYFFCERNKLSTIQGADGFNKYTVDFNHDARFGKTKSNRWLAAAISPPDRLPIRTAKDKQGLTYRTTQLKKDTEITGHPIVQLWVSSTADFGDFFVYLEDLDEKGNALLVTEGVLRAGFTNLYDNDEMIRSGETGVDVLPNLPCHGYKKSQYVDRIFADDNIIELVFDLQPTSWVFKKGHRIRVTIVGVDWPTFQLHPRLAPDNRPDNPANIVPIITIYYDSEHPSCIKLPVIP